MALDQPAAEAAIRQAYRASSLPEPREVLWARGPREAVEALAFLGNSPRRQRRFSLAVLAAGAVALPALALALAEGGGGADTGEPSENPAVLLAAILAFALAWVSSRQLPNAPDHELPSVSPGKLMLTGSAVFAVLAGFLVFIQFSGLPADPAARGGYLAGAALVGALPGAILLFRLQRTYARLPGSLQGLAPGRSVARQLMRARREARPLFPRSRRSAVRPDESLLRAYRAAYMQALSGPPALEPASTMRTRLDQTVWGTPGSVRSFDPVLFGMVPPNLDGLEDAELAAATEGQGSVAAAAFGDLSYHVDRLFPFSTVALAVQPATTIVLDAEGRPHAEGGPAVAWADGTRVYAWRGRLVDRDLVEGKPPTLSRIWREPDQDRRWVLIERYGLGRYLLDNAATQIQTDACGRLYRLEHPGEPIVAVRVVNGTPEPDGSLAEFWLRVPPTMRTAREAVAWTFGLSPEEYSPAAQS